MAVSLTLLTSAYSSTDAASYTTASVAPTAGQPLLLAVQSRNSTGSSNVFPNSITGLGQTWVEVARAPATGTATSHLILYRASGVGATTGTVVIGFAATVLGCSYAVIQSAGADTTTPVVQSAISDVTANTTTVTLAAFASAANATFGVFGSAVNEAMTVGSGFTSIAAANGASPTTGFMAEFNAGNDTTVDASWTTSGKAGGIAIEIAAAAVADRARSMRLAQRAVQRASIY